MPAQASDSRKTSVARMVTQDRAASVARALFPDDIADGTDCHVEYGRKGEPCQVCADRNAAWEARIAAVREAMIAAFR